MKVIYITTIMVLLSPCLNASKNKTRNQLRDERINLLIDQHNRNMHQLRREIKKEIKESTHFNLKRV